MFSEKADPGAPGAQSRGPAEGLPIADILVAEENTALVMPPSSTARIWGLFHGLVTQGEDLSFPAGGKIFRTGTFYAEALSKRS